MSTSSRSDGKSAEGHRTLLCTSIFARTFKDLAAKATIALSSGSDLVEFRLDHLERFRLGEAEAISPFLERCIFTVRPRSEGGHFRGTEPSRLGLITQLSELNPCYFDVELRTLSRNPGIVSRLDGTKVIVSWHDLRGTPSSRHLLEVVSEASSYGGTPKVVTTARESADNLKVLNLYDEFASPLVAFCMGPLGLLSRMMAMERGSPIAYASLSGESTAPGQPTLESMLAFRRIGFGA